MLRAATTRKDYSKVDWTPAFLSATAYSGYLILFMYIINWIQLRVIQVLLVSEKREVLLEVSGFSVLLPANAYSRYLILGVCVFHKSDPLGGTFGF